MLHAMPAFAGMHVAEHQSGNVDAKPGLVVSTRPEIRKGCSWDINLRFTLEIISKFGLKTIFVEKPRAASPGRDAFYLCIKVRSKLMQPRRELGFRKVAEVENDLETIELNEQGVAVLKVKFTQRPRSVFHKHSDTMILVVALKSAKDDRVVVSDEHELVFRGGTGSVHSADARKKMILAGEMKKAADLPAFGGSSLHQPAMHISRAVERPYLDSEESEDGATAHHVAASTRPLEADLSAQPQCEPLTVQIFETLREDYASSSVMNEYKDEMELYQMPWLSAETGTMSAFAPGAADALLASHVTTGETENIAADEAKFTYDGGTRRNFAGLFCSPVSERRLLLEADTSSAVVLDDGPQIDSMTQREPTSIPSAGMPSYEGVQTRGRKRSMQDRDMTPPAPAADDHGAAFSPAAKRPKYSLEDRYFQKLFFKTLPFLTLEELRSVCGQAPIPMFVKDEQGVYKWANHIFCAFILDANMETVINRRPSQFLNAQEGEEVVKSDQYLLQREPGLIQTFDLNVKCQPYKVMKMYTRLRDGNRVVVGAVGQF